MRTKVLVCAAALAASLASSMAQNVYSLNVVGYCNVTVAGGGFALLANPLKTTNNYLKEVVPPASVAPGSVLSTWDLAAQKFNEIITDGTMWIDPSLGTDLGTTLLTPGKGFLLNNVGGSLTLTFVGEVQQGDVTLAIPTGNGCYGTTTPQALELSATNGFPQIANNWVHLFDTVGVKYIDYVNDGTTWLDPSLGTPVVVAPAIGQGYFIENTEANNNNWVRNFTVQ